MSNNRDTGNVPTHKNASKDDGRKKKLFERRQDFQHQPWLSRTVDHVHGSEADAGVQTLAHSMMHVTSLPTLNNNDTKTSFYLDLKTLKSLLPHRTLPDHRSKLHRRLLYSKNTSSLPLLDLTSKHTGANRFGALKDEEKPSSSQRRRDALRLNMQKASTPPAHVSVDLDGRRADPLVHANGTQGPMKKAKKALRIMPAHRPHKKRRRPDQTPQLQVNETLVDPHEEEEERQKIMIAAQLNLTLEEYDALDVAFGGKESTTASASSGKIMEAKYREVFDTFDVDKSGSISPSELRQLLTEAGEEMDDAELEVVLKQADANGDGEIDFDEFMGLMKARKRLLLVANHMGPTQGKAPEMTKHHRTNVRHRNKKKTEARLKRTLPPVHATKSQSQSSAAHSNSTPDLTSNVSTDLAQLRRELAVSEIGINVLNDRVRDGVQWVQKNCPVTSLKAQIYCQRWGVQTLQQIYLRMQSRAISRAMSKWHAFCAFERNKERAHKFLKFKGIQVLSTILTRWKQRQYTWSMKTWATYCHRQMQFEVHSAAIELQRSGRGFLARRRATLLKQHVAIEHMQTCVRMFIAKLEAYRLRQALLEYNAAALLQRAYRGFAGRQLGRMLFLAQKENLAARRIQRTYRSFHEYKLLRIIQRTNLENHAATAIQSGVRGWFARQERAALYRQRQREIGAQLIQRCFRGMQGRREAHMRRERCKAAIVLQCAIRSSLSRHRLYLLRRERDERARRALLYTASTRIQAKWKGYAGRKRYLSQVREMQRQSALLKFKRATAVVLIQCAYRAYCARRRLQRLRYEKLKWMQFRLLNKSALCIQSHWRAYHGRLAGHLLLQAKTALFEEQTEASIKIQSALRGRRARKDHMRRMQQMEQRRQEHLRLTRAVLCLQSRFRGRRARRIAANIKSEHQTEAQRALARLVQQTKENAATKIQCCARRYLALRALLKRQQDVERRKRQELDRQTQEKAALVLQCALRRWHARRQLVAKRHAFEKRISMMASEKAMDDIERLRKEQEQELIALKLQLMKQQQAAEEQAAKLKEELEKQKVLEEERHEEEAKEIAALRLQTLHLEQQKQRPLSRASTRHLSTPSIAEAAALKEELERQRESLKTSEENLRTYENEELAKAKLANLFTTNEARKEQAKEEKAREEEEIELVIVSKELQEQQAKYKIQSFCIKHLVRRRLLRMQQEQAASLAKLEDEEERLRLQAAQSKELALARLKALMDEEARQQEQEVKAMEMQMLERAKREKVRQAKRHQAAGKIQSVARGYLGRVRVKQTQQRIERERNARTKEMEEQLATAEAKLKEALSEQETAAAEEAADNWVEYWDESAQTSYFYNIKTQEATWTRPTCWGPADTTMDTSASANATEYAYQTVPVMSMPSLQYYTSYFQPQPMILPSFMMPQAYADNFGYYDPMGQYHYYNEAQAFNSSYYLPTMTNPAADAYTDQSLSYETTEGSEIPVDAATDQPWQQYYDEHTGAAYYYNRETGENYWA